MALAPIARTLLPADSPELKERLDLIAARTVESGVGIELAARTASDYYRKTGRLDEAISVLQKHLEVRPASLSLRTRLGLLQLYAKQEDAGLATLHEALQIDSGQILAHRALAEFFERNAEPEKALFHAAEVLRIAGGAPEDFLDLANQYLELDKPHPARLLLERARFDHPENPALAARLAIAVLRDGDSTSATRVFREAEALARDSTDPAAKESLDSDFQIEFAGALRDAGDIGAADERLVGAIRGIPPDQPKKTARALRELARLRIAQNKTLGLAGLLNKADSLDPGHPETKELLESAKGSGK
jgi:tetratricopeptide (TPR) repeat protein